MTPAHGDVALIATDFDLSAFARGITVRIEPGILPPAKIGFILASASQAMNLVGL